MKMMKSVLALCVFGSLVAFGTLPAMEEGAEPITTTSVAPDATPPLTGTAAELLEELNCLESDEAVAAFFKEHYDFESELLETSGSLVSGGCGSWITVARCVQYRKCWVGTTSNGTKYGIYYQNRFTC